MLEILSQGTGFLDIEGEQVPHVHNSIISIGSMQLIMIESVTDAIFNYVSRVI